jgi:peptidoglycan hydrolase CwlO-like protein
MSNQIETLLELVKELTEKLEQQQKTIDRIESLVDELDNRL